MCALTTTRPVLTTQRAISSCSMFESKHVARAEMGDELHFICQVKEFGIPLMIWLTFSKATKALPR